VLDIIPKWFIILVLNFLVLIYILNVILYRPLMKIFKERDNSTKGSLEAAREMDKKREEGISEMNRELKEARRKAGEIFENMRKEGLNNQKEMLEGANGDAQNLIEKARVELKTEAENARRKLHADIDAFSDEIVKKLVKA
jgi:F-type H+-transporting ATPase subunit b